MMQDDLLALDEPLKQGGIRSVNFFNGRLLAAKDLTREQQARREADARLGLAIGEGVAFGLEVERDAAQDTPSAPVLRVKAGLAINRTGQSLRLPVDTSVALTRRYDAPEAACVFTACNPVGDGTYVAGAGVYLLCIAPAQQAEGRAASNGLDPANVRCQTDAHVEAVQLRLLSINPLRFADLDPAAPQFRNRLAYRCFGIEARADALADPWRSEPLSYGLVDELRATTLSERDVPLALVYWTVGGLRFVDMWAVRRRVIAQDALGATSQRNPPNALESSAIGSPARAFIASDRRLAEAQAMCAQFQAHLADLLVATAAPSTLLAAAHFRYLPPFGVVPLAATPLRGFAVDSFFSGIARRPGPGVAPDKQQDVEYIDARLLGGLRQQALASAPTDLNSREFIWLYRPWQNAKAWGEQASVQPVVVFASGILPPAAVARFDMARFDFSNYSDCCDGL